MADVPAWAREKGWARVRLRVFRGHSTARRLYARLGSVREDEIMEYAVS